MTDYKCGHEVETILLDSNPLSISAYLTWKDEAGFDGDKTLCWKCWCERQEQERIEREI